MALKERLIHAWNAFNNARDPTEYEPIVYSTNSVSHHMKRYGIRTIINPIINRIAVDCAAIRLEHGRLDDNGQFADHINSSLNYCLSEEANVDQAARAFRQDIFQSMCDEGVVAIVPIDTDDSPEDGAATIYSMRTGRIVQWYPHRVKVEVYNERTGRDQEIYLDKSAVGIVENPLYSIMNEPNSTMQRLITKLQLLDAVDEQHSSGKLDLIIQLPYTIKSEARRKEAERRKTDIEMQLTSGKYGIAYTDGSERITQLNRPVENTLNQQVEALQQQLYNQLGLTKEIFEGTADEQAMLNYYNRTIEPLVAAVVEEMNRKFLTKTARTQKQKIVYFNDPFKLVPMEKLADIADKFTRNEILSSNELRAIIGYKPVATKEANELRNKNLNRERDQEPTPINPEEGGENQNAE